MVDELAFQKAISQLGPVDDEFNQWHLDEGAIRHFIAVYEAAKQPAVEWQSMETAPRTGKVIIMYGKTRHAEFDHVDVGHWYKPYSKWAWHGYLGDEPKQPTHWMPLPAPPTQTKE